MSAPNADNPVEPDCAIALDPRVVIGDVNTLKKKLSESGQDNRKVVIDASGVESVDTAALQLLTAYAGACADLSWRKPSEVFRDKAELLGLSGALKLEQEVGDDDDGDSTGDDDDLCPVF